MKPLCIVIQYHEADRPAATELCRLIGSLETRYRNEARIYLAHRFDAESIPWNDLFELTDKFQVIKTVTSSRAIGWPDGPNGMALEMLNTLVHPENFNSTLGILLLEPDCIPIQRDWIDQLKAEWEKALAAGKWLMGTWRDGGGTLGHVNGNMLVRPDFAKLVDLSQVPASLAWDCAISPQVHEHWHITNLICNRWQEKNLTDDQIEAHRDGGSVRPVLVHGCKDRSVIDYARRKLLS